MTFVGDFCRCCCCFGANVEPVKQAKRRVCFVGWDGDGRLGRYRQRNCRSIASATYRSLAATVVTLCLLKGVGPATDWCWVVSGNWLRLTFYIPLIFALGIVIFTYVMGKRALRKARFSVPTRLFLGCPFCVSSCFVGQCASGLSSFVDTRDRISMSGMRSHDRKGASR